MSGQKDNVKTTVLVTLNPMATHDPSEPEVIKPLMITQKMSPAEQTAAYASFPTPHLPHSRDSWNLDIIFQIYRDLSETTSTRSSGRSSTEPVGTKNGDWLDLSKVHVLPVYTVKQATQSAYQVVTTTSSSTATVSAIATLPQETQMFLGGYLEEMRRRSKCKAIILKGYTSHGGNFRFSIGVESVF